MSHISLLFAVEAEQLLLAGMPEEAIELCNEGLEVYPDYAAAISVLAKAYKILGDANKAQSLISNSKESMLASSYLHIKESVEKLSTDEIFPVDENVQDLANNFQIIDDLEPYEMNKVDDAEIVDETKDRGEIDIDEINPELEIQNVIEDNNDIEKYDLIDDDISSSGIKDEETDKEFENLVSEIPTDELIEEQLDKNVQPEIIKADISSPVKNKKGLTERINSEHLSFKSSDISIIPGLNRYKAGNVTSLFVSNKPVKPEKVLKLAKKQSNFISIMSSLSKAETIKPEISKKVDRHKSSVVITETIAGILVQQGAYAEAKSAYLELSKKFPDKKKYFKSKIAEIDDKLR